MSEGTRRLVEELVRFLRRESVEVRLYGGRKARQFPHAKCYLLYGDLRGQASLSRTSTRWSASSGRAISPRPG